MHDSLFERYIKRESNEGICDFNPQHKWILHQVRVDSGIININIIQFRLKNITFLAL